MQKLEVVVCVCTHCIMNGAMDIVESIESLSKLKNQLRFNTTIKVVADKSICEKGGSEASPIVFINGDRIERATSDLVTAKIVSLVSSR